MDENDAQFDMSGDYAKDTGPDEELVLSDDNDGTPQPQPPFSATDEQPMETDDSTMQFYDAKPYP
jgi:hypothetical protein